MATQRAGRLGHGRRPAHGVASNPTRCRCDRHGLGAERDVAGGRVGRCIGAEDLGGGVLGRGRRMLRVVALVAVSKGVPHVQ
eukprot:1691438-Heterocapsa_arctica.AAC.1